MSDTGGGGDGTSHSSSSIDVSDDATRSLLPAIHPSSSPRFDATAASASFVGRNGPAYGSLHHLRTGHKHTRLDDEDDEHDFPSLAAGSIHEIGCCGATFLLLPWPHLKRLFALAIPSVIGALLSVVINIVNLAFIGHLSPELLGGAALGNAFMLISGYCVLIGLCSSLDTLCAQAYGAHQTRLVGLIAQRAAMAYTLVVIPILAMWCRTEDVFLLAGQDPHISALAGEYVFYCLPTIFPILYSEIIKRYLQAQSIMAPQIYVACVANLVHALAAYAMMFKLDWGLRGASIGLCIGLSTNLLCWLVYLQCINRRVSRRTCPRLNLSALFSGWWPLFRLGIPGCLMMLFEWASFELCAVGAGWMGGVQLDTIIVFSNLCTFLTMAPSGIAISTSTMVGHAIGAGKDEHARLYAHAAACMILVFAGAESVLLGLLHNHLVRVFSSSHVVSQSFSAISMSVALFVMFDCFQTVAGGVLRGLGYQSFGATTNGVVFYLFGLPLGFTLAFYFQMGVPGLVIGLVTSVVTQTLVFGWRLVRVDWKEETNKAEKRIEEEKPDPTLIAAIEAIKSIEPDEEDDED